MNLTKNLVLVVILFFTTLTFAQNDKKEISQNKNEKFLNWYNKDYSSDNIMGVGTEKTYNELLKGKKSSTVIVAVIDGGVDIYHEDLKDVIWTNEDEIAGNGIDDDKNGYIDDIHGWNFIGNAAGKNVNEDNLEITRIYRKYKDKYAGKTEKDIAENEKKTFEMYKKAEKDYLEQVEKNSKMQKNIDIFIQNYEFTDSILKAYLKKDTYTLEDLNKITTTDKQLQDIIGFQKYVLSKEIKIKETKDYLDYLNKKTDYQLNLNFNGRAQMGDNYEVMDNIVYGNNEVKGPRADHGTHVAGIIAAKRNNGLGINGIADNVKIMVVRTVPDGDEHDKDVANSIIYAVDNGAQIINMSFGKDYSPYKEYVDKAVKYAEEKGVLIIHAAGNDSKNIDVESNFPTDKFVNGNTVANWVEVGASSMNKDKTLCGVFSNYGAQNVDVFAPGVNIYSTIPESLYEVKDGTSMAAPVTTGVAAVLKSYFPELTAVQIKEILLKSVSPYSKKVYLPTEEEKPSKIKFKKLSVSGGVVNLYNAVKIAETEYKK